MIASTFAENHIYLYRLDVQIAVLVPPFSELESGLVSDELLLVLSVCVH